MNKTSPILFAQQTTTYLENVPTGIMLRLVLKVHKVMDKGERMSGCTCPGCREQVSAYMLLGQPKDVYFGYSEGLRKKAVTGDSPLHAQSSSVVLSALN